jgi:hypothetical protein
MRPATRTLPLALALLPLAVAGRLHAQTATATPAGIDRIEEDWELVLGTPSPEEVGPQITTTMSPVGDNQSMFLSFNLNYRDDPYQAGGLQVRAWSGDRSVGSMTQGSALLRTAGETITWTQRMSLSGGELSYEISAGDSTTWGKFGQGGLLGVGTTASLSSLDGYSPDVSVQSSSPTWQSNRVTSMRLVEVRYYRGGNLVATDDTPRSVAVGP